jgi:Holliday junction resolvasome RuvABC endonuclease subunit
MLIGVRVIGIDPSSTSLGWAIVDDGVPINIGVWVPKPKSAKSNKRLMQCDLFLAMLFGSYKPDEMCMEVIRVSTSHDTTRSLSRFEASVLLNAMRHDVVIHEFQVGEARKAVFSERQGNIKKHHAHAIMRHTYPSLPWQEMLAPNGKDDGPGCDQSDALIAALARDALAERPNGRAKKRSKSGS